MPPPRLRSVPSFSQLNVQNNASRSNFKCFGCHDDPGEYTWVNGLRYCRPCTTSVQCAGCDLELFTAIQADGKYLKTNFSSDKPINSDTLLTFYEMNQYTTLYGHENPRVKPVYNFFQQSKKNPLNPKSKTQTFCFGCLKSNAKKLMSPYKQIKKVIPPNQIISIDFGMAGRIRDAQTFENILSFLPMPSNLVTILLVHSTWRNYITKQSDFSWISNIHFDHIAYPTENPLFQNSLSNQSSANPDANHANSAIEWSDASLLKFIKSLSHQNKFFHGFENLQSISADWNGVNHKVTDYGILCLAELIPRRTIRNIDLSLMTFTTWISIMALIRKSDSINSLGFSGYEHYQISKHLFGMEVHKKQLKSLKHLSYSRVEKIALSTLVELEQFSDLQSLRLSETTLFWDKRGIWDSIPQFPKLKHLDLSNTLMPLRDSCADLFCYFPNLENVFVTSVRRTNIADNVVMFKKCGPAFTEDIAAVLEYRVAEHEEYIIRKGEIGREMYFLRSGQVQVVADNGKVIVTLPAGVFFGEIALLFDTPRTASIRALGRCELLVLDQPQLFRVMRQHPESKKIIKEEASQRWKALQEKQKGPKQDLKEKDEKKVEPQENKQEEEKKNDTPPPPPPTKPPQAKGSLIQEITERYGTELRRLRISGKGLELKGFDFLSTMKNLQEFYINLETTKKTPILNLSFPAQQYMLPHLETLGISLEQSQYQLSAEEWLSLAKAAPFLKVLTYSRHMSSQSLANIVSNMSELEILEIPDSSSASKEISLALSQLPIREIVSDCVAKADSIIKGVAKNQSDLRILSLNNCVFNESQLEKLLSTSRHLQYVSVQTTTMASINPPLFKNKYPKYSHVEIHVNKSTKTSKKSSFRNLVRSSSKASMDAKLTRTPSQSVLSSGSNSSRKMRKRTSQSSFDETGSQGSKKSISPGRSPRHSPTRISPKRVSSKSSSSSLNRTHSNSSSPHQSPKKKSSSTNVSPQQVSSASKKSSSEKKLKPVRVSSKNGSPRHPISTNRVTSTSTPSLASPAVEIELKGTARVEKPEPSPLARPENEENQLSNETKQKHDEETEKKEIPSGETTELEKESEPQENIENESKQETIQDIPESKDTENNNGIEKAINDDKSINVDEKTLDKEPRSKTHDQEEHADDISIQEEESVQNSMNEKICENKNNHLQNDEPIPTGETESEILTERSEIPKQETQVQQPNTNIARKQVPLNVSSIEDEANVVLSQMEYMESKRPQPSAKTQGKLKPIKQKKTGGVKRSKSVDVSSSKFHLKSGRPHRTKFLPALNPTTAGKRSPYVRPAYKII